MKWFILAMGFFAVSDYLSTIQTDIIFVVASTICGFICIHKAVKDE